MYPLMFEYHKLIKLLIIGNSGVGKSSILMRFADDSFKEQYIYTIGVDFKVRTLNIDGKVVKLQIWDTAGQERFRAFTAAYFRGAHGVVVVYDISDRQSFIAVTNWLRDIEKYCSDKSVTILLIGNKCDVNNKRSISYQEAKELANQMGILFLETSAKEGTNVDAAFQLIASQIIMNLSNKAHSSHQIYHHRSTVDIRSPHTSNKSCCFRS